MTQRWLEQARPLDAELAVLQDQVKQLQAQNARLLRLLELNPQEARPPGPAQAGIFDAAPGGVHAGSLPALKVAFFRALFAARTDVYAVRWESGRSGSPAGRRRSGASSGWRRRIRCGDTAGFTAS